MQTDSFVVLPQFEGLYGDYTYKVLAGGRASGKSVAGSDAATTYMEPFVLEDGSYSFSSIRILCLRSFECSIDQSIRAEIISSMERRGTKWQYKITDYEIVNTITNSVIHFKGIDRNPENVKSYSGYHIAILEEAQTITQKAWELLNPTIRAEGAQVWIIFNPRLASDIVWRIFMTGNPPPNTWISRSTWKDNPFLSEKGKLDALHMEATDPEGYSHHYLGQLVQNSDLQIVKLRDCISAKTRQITIDNDRPLIAALDVARFGKNESVLFYRRGDDCTRFRAWKGLDSRQLMLSVIDELRGNDVRHLIIDDPGVGGAGVYDHIKPYLPSVSVHRFLGGGRPSDPTRFNNKRTECYFLASDAIARSCRIPDDHMLIDQACALSYDYDNKDKRRAISKDKLEEQGVLSPDRFDAFSMLFDPTIHTDSTAEGWSMEDYAD